MRIKSLSGGKLPVMPRPIINKLEEEKKVDL